MKPSMALLYRVGPAASIRFLRGFRALLSGVQTLPLKLHGLVHLLLRLLQGFLRLLELLLPRRGGGGRGTHRFDATACERVQQEQHDDRSESHGPSLPRLFYHAGGGASVENVTPYFGRLSMTRFALPIERSIVPIFTSALTPT
jgi:hypothetical protein